jgi:hypothetical protein
MEQSDMNIGDLNSTEKGTAARANGGKVRFSLLPTPILSGVCRVLEFGLRKYREWNWTKGMQWSACFDCDRRHMDKWYFGLEECDEESGLHHLDHAICNLLFLRHYTKVYTEGDDRPDMYTMLAEWNDELTLRRNVNDCP